jgi:hypothetical protein
MEEYMDAVEGNSPQTCLFALLEEDQVSLPPPDTISDADITDVLWKVIHKMAALGAYLSSTNHLSDRELYNVLWNDILRDDYPVVTEEFPLVSFMDVLGKWSSEDVQTWLKYYADEKHARVLPNLEPIRCRIMWIRRINETTFCPKRAVTADSAKQKDLLERATPDRFI